MIKILIAVCLLLTPSAKAQGPILPPEVTPKSQSGDRTSEKTKLSSEKYDKVICLPREDVEGKCVCPKQKCPKVKTVVKWKTKTVTKTKYVDKPVEKVVEKVVEKPTDFKRFSITGFFGRAPEGVDRVLYKRQNGYPEYKAYKNYGDVLGLQGTYRFTESWSASVLYVTNESYLGGVGFSF